MNERQRRFADEYIISGNAYQSALKAGYSEKYAKARSSELLDNVGISDYIKNRMEELQDEKILTQKQILVMLSEIASGQAKETIVVTTKVAELMTDPVTGKSVKVYNEIPQLVEYPTKNSDRNKALELLGKRHKMWTDKVEADVSGTVVFQMSQTYQIKQNDIVVDLPKTVGAGYGQFWRSRNLYRVVKGSRGSKKSKTTALNYVVRLLKYPWANLLVIRRYSNTNKQSTYTDFKWACNVLGVTHLFKFNESLPEITIKATGQKILFRGLDDELKITSITVDVGILCWAWFEEAYQIETEDKFSTVVESIRGSLDVPDFFKQITVTFNPWNERHWLKRVFFDEETRRADTFATTTTYKCNEWLDEVDIKRYEDLYHTNPRRARIVCDGEWGVAEGLIYENVTVKDFDKDELLQDSAYKLCIGLDFGFTHDPTALCCSLINDTTKEIYVFDEAYKVGLITKEVAKMIKDKGYHRSQIIADSAELRLIEELRSEHGITRIKESRKGKDSIMAGVSKLQGYAIYVHPDCKNIMDEFYSYCYQQDKEGNWLNKPEDKNNHLMDALRYSLQCIEGGKATVRRRSDYGL